MFTRILLASVFIAGHAAGQFGTTPVIAPNTGVTGPIGGVGSAIANLPLFFFGGLGRTGGIPGAGPVGGPLNGFGMGSSLRGFYGNNLNPYLGGGLGWGYYPNPWVYPQQAPVGTYANPDVVKPVTDLPPTLIAPETPKSDAWADARTSFASASSRVSTARRSVEELRARLAAMGQSPRANILTNIDTAEAVLRSAQDAMAAGDLERSQTEIRRASDIAGVVLKEFGR